MTEYHIHQTITKQQNACDNVQASHLSKKYVISSNTKKSMILRSVCVGVCVEED